MKPTSQRFQCLKPHFFSAHEARVANMVANGQDIIRLDIGSPDLPPAPPIIAALQRSVENPKRHGYQTHLGPKALREAWAGMYRRVHGVELDPASEILPLMGSKEGIFNMSQTFLGPGDAALIPDPGYITYTSGTLFAGAEPVFMPLLPERGFLPDLQAVPLEVLQRAKLLWLNYPNNPTAAIAGREFLEEAVEFARRHDLLLCFDAAYSQVTFDGYRPPSVLEIPGAKDVAVEFNSLSKSHNMAGWRLAALVGNRAAVKALYTLKTNIDASHFLPIMDAAVEAMTGDQAWLVERNAVYQRRRDVAVEGLQRLGFVFEPPRASLYVWFPVPAGYTSVEYATLLLEQASISLTPGTVFGAGGEGYMRLALTAPEERIAEAMERLKRLA